MIYYPLDTSALLSAGFAQNGGNEATEELFFVEPATAFSMPPMK